jgi:hypothetical protein
MKINPWALLLWVVMTPAALAYAQEPPMPGVASPKPPGPIKPAQEQKTPSVDATSLEELMLEKGLISQDDYIRLKAEQERRLSESATMAEFTASPRWYERLRHYGYGQLRYNQLGNPNGRIMMHRSAMRATEPSRDFSIAASAGSLPVKYPNTSASFSNLISPATSAGIPMRFHFATPGENGISIRRKNSDFEPVCSVCRPPGTTGKLPANAWQSIVRMPPTPVPQANATLVSHFSGRQNSPNSGGST